MTKASLTNGIAVTRYEEVQLVLKAAKEAATPNSQSFYITLTNIATTSTLKRKLKLTPSQVRSDKCHYALPHMRYLQPIIQQGIEGIAFR